MKPVHKIEERDTSMTQKPASSRGKLPLHYTNEILG